MIRKVAHVALVARNLARSVDFYTRVIGMKVVSYEAVPEKNVRVAFLELGEVELEISCTSGQEERQYGERARSHFPHLAFEVDDVAAGMKELARKGVTFENAKPQLIFDARVCYNTFLGPDGETLEICHRTP
jgi:catechol 2,3-dioxygenase-like lactoylglutathione lyase family enzyme